MLEIRDIQYFPDGRSVVDTMGGRRFKVVERGTKDGYSTATVEFLHDVVPEGQELVGMYLVFIVQGCYQPSYSRSAATPRQDPRTRCLLV